MSQSRAANKRRQGLSLLEMMAATAIMATVTAAVVVVMNTGFAVWSAQEADIDVLENGYGVLRHFCRQMRQATGITAITAAGNTTGSLSFTSATGATCTWGRDVSSNVYYNNGTSNQLLAKGINSLTFTGLKADGLTATTTVTDIQVVQCQVQVTLPRGAGVTRTLTTRAWIRAW
jgi:prepilin-type N-terminal cleavage/methylation domain-containing protein